MENCIIACESPEFVKDALEDLRLKSALWPFTFAWTCEVTTGQRSAEVLLVIGEADIRIFESSHASATSRKTFQVLLEIPVDDASIKKCNGRECTVLHGLHQALVVLFPTPDIMERFVQCFSRCVGQTVAVRDGRSSSVTSTNTTRSLAGEHSGKQSSSRSKDEAMLLVSTDTDYFHLGSNKAFCTKARHKWQKWTSIVRKKGQEEALFHVGETKSSERGLASVLLSTDAQLGPDTHEVLVVTDVALFIVKRRDPTIVKVFLPIIGVESIQMATSSGSNGGTLNDPVVEWTVMIILDLQIPVTTHSTDIKLRMDSRNKNLFLSHLSRQYEALRLQRLPTMVLESTIFWRKRSFFETKLMRIAGKVKSGIVRATGGVEAQKSEEGTAQNLREALVDHTESFVHALCKESIRRTNPEDQEELGFIARSLLSTARRCGTLQAVILAAVSFETTRVFSMSSHSKSGLSRSEVAGFFRSRTLVDAIVQEHCMHAGEQYLRVQLAQMMEEFVSSTSTSNEGIIPDTECLRYVKELTTVLAESSHNDSLFPDIVRELMTMIRTVHQGIDENQRSGFGNWSPLDDFVANFFIGRAVESPQSHGLVSAELNVSQLQMLQLISRVFQRVASFNLASTAGNSALADHPLHDLQATNLKRVCASSQFQLFAPTSQPKIHEFAERLVADGHAKKEVEKLYDRMLRPAPRATTKVARAPLLDSDVKVLHMMHGLLEKRAASVMNATFVDDTSLRSPARAASLRFRDPSPRKSFTEPAPLPTPPPTASKKTMEDNNALRERLGRLEQAMEQAKSQLSTSTEVAKRLAQENRAKDEELLRMKRMLLEMDQHYFPDASTFVFDNHYQEGPMMMQQESATSVYAFCSPRRVFACPLDSYTVRHVDFSPRDLN